MSIRRSFRFLYERLRITVKRYVAVQFIEREPVNIVKIFCDRNRGHQTLLFFSIFNRQRCRQERIHKLIRFYIIFLPVQSGFRCIPDHLRCQLMESLGSTFRKVNLIVFQLNHCTIVECLRACISAIDDEFSQRGLHEAQVILHILPKPF